MSLQKNIKALFVGNNDEANFVNDLLGKPDNKNIEISFAETIEEAINELGKTINVDIVVLELKSDSNLDTDKQRKFIDDNDELLPVLIYTTDESNKMVEAFVQDGAQDYICKSKLSCDCWIQLTSATF